MFVAILYTGLLSLTAHAVQGKCIESPQIPDGITVHKVISTWEEADLKCKSKGAVLASPINTDLLNTMKSLISMNKADYLIGTKASHYLGTFMSVEGVPLDNMTAAVLEMVQQLDPRKGDCLCMDEHNIRVVPCWKRLPFMCYRATKDKNATEVITQRTVLNLETTEELKQEDTTEQESEGDVNMKMCMTDDNGYIYNRDTNSCYKKHTELLSWDAASAACEAEEAHLLVIDNINENRVFQHMNLTDVAPAAYIGLRDYNRTGQWKTVTGKKLNEIYVNWYYGDPFMDHMTCAVIYPGGEVDNMHCTNGKPFICEKEKNISSYLTL